MAIGDKVYIADKPTLDVVNAKTGTTTDTGGTATTGGVFAKLNAILQQFLSNWTVARAVKIDTIDTKIGTATDTGGSTTAGTVMGKLNALQNNGAIKSIQRGTATISIPANFTTIPLLEVNISNVNTSKVSVNAWGTSSNNYVFGLIAPLSVQSSSVTFCYIGQKWSSLYTTVFAYEIIEYE